MSDTVVCAGTAATEEPDLSVLIHAVARHERTALESLYRTCRQSVYAVALGVTRDRQLAEDVLQDTMLYLWEHADAYRRDGHPKAWICTISRHLAIDRMRKNNRSVLLESWDQIPDASGRRSAPEMEDDMALGQAIGRLPLEEAQVILLSAFGGLSHGEIAELMQLPYHKVRYRYRRAIAKLRALLADDM
jgi:RNA polymerase sigma-70 factor (ECF subfamily)